MLLRIALLASIAPQGVAGGGARKGVNDSERNPPAYQESALQNQNNFSLRCFKLILFLPDNSLIGHKSFHKNKNDTQTQTQLYIMIVSKITS